MILSPSLLGTLFSKIISFKLSLLDQFHGGDWSLIRTVGHSLEYFFLFKSKADM